MRYTLTNKAGEPEVTGVPYTNRDLRLRVRYRKLTDPDFEQQFAKQLEELKTTGRPSRELLAALGIKPEP